VRREGSKTGGVEEKGSELVFISTVDRWGLVSYSYAWESGFTTWDVIVTRVAAVSELVIVIFAGG